MHGAEARQKPCTGIPAGLPRAQAGGRTAGAGSFVPLLLPPPAISAAWSEAGSPRPTGSCLESGTATARQRGVVCCLLTSRPFGASMCAVPSASTEMSSRPPATSSPSTFSGR
ncbi:hypothetical protein GA0115254_12423 [Streptomyces sp. Ncost-T10-10d]|nr:hypothetical protein GA0115254_12423 [Streptomyces sp. Ncost-T10-10d]